MSHSIDRNEVSYYPEICERLERTLKGYLPNGRRVVCKHGKDLQKTIEEFKGDFPGREVFSGDEDVPDLKTDIIVGIEGSKENLVLALVEVKSTKSLALKDYSQLVGYLIVAKRIKFGLLLSVRTDDNSNTLSNDFHDIFRKENLPMEWKMIVSRGESIESLDFRTGIVSYVPGDGFDWTDPKGCKGLRGFEDLLIDI